MTKPPKATMWYGTKATDVSPWYGVYLGQGIRISRRFEKELIIQALKKSSGVQVEAAKLLGLNHKNLWHKIKKHNIDLNGL